MLRDPAACGYDGKLFEQIVHRKFGAGCRIGLVNHWDTPPLEINTIAFDNKADGYFHFLDVGAAPGSCEVHDKYLKRYLVAISKTKGSVDSVWLSKDRTVFFQVTVKTNPGINGPGIIELVNELPSDARRNVSIVFVVPLSHKATELQSFKPQEVIFPDGTPKEQIDQVAAYRQYVYYFDLRCL
jgi:hypothetical protein